MALPTKLNSIVSSKVLAPVNWEIPNLLCNAVSETITLPMLLIGHAFY